MGYYSTINGYISGIKIEDFNNLKEDMEEVFGKVSWEETDGGTIEINSHAKHRERWTHPVYDKIAAAMQPKGEGELEEIGEEETDISSIFFIKDRWEQLWAEIKYPENPFKKEKNKCLTEQ